MTITTRDSLLTIRGLSASVDETPILHDIDLAVGPGETHVIMGPNGAGKSTLGHVVMGDAAYRVDGGSVEFDGRDITDLSPDKRSRAGLFLSFQAPVEIPGVPLSSFLRATVAGRDGKELKGKQFKKHVRALADELDMDPSWTRWAWCRAASTRTVAPRAARWSSSPTTRASSSTSTSTACTSWCAAAWWPRATPRSSNRSTSRASSGSSKPVRKRRASPSPRYRRHA